MKAIQITTPGGPEVLQLTDWPDPEIGPRELLVEIAATALNRADTLQRKGLYPVPPGASLIPGLEMAGTVIAIGPEVQGYQIGDRVCSLLTGGGYATQVAIDEQMVLPIPASLSFEQAAAIPEVFLTAFQALRWLANVQRGERVLIHAGASGVGTAAIQLAKEWGCEVFATASAPKHELCRQLGADHLIDYKTENFAEVIKATTDGQGVDTIIDFIGAPYFSDNLKALGLDGRLIILAFMGGAKAEETSIATILRKRLQIIGTTLRSRSDEYKIRLNKEFQEACWSLFASGDLQPVIDSIYDWKEVAEAHRYMESNQNKGKIILKVK